MTDGPRPEDRIDFASLERLSANAPPPKEPTSWTPKILAALVFLIAAAVVLAVPWYFLTRPGKTSAATSPSAAATSATPSPSPSPSLSFGPGLYEVTGVDNCLRVHAEPGTGSPVFDCLGPGVRAQSDGETEEFGGTLWLHIQDPFKKGAAGWVSAEFVKKAS